MMFFGYKLKDKNGNLLGFSQVWRLELLHKIKFKNNDFLKRIKRKRNSTFMRWYEKTIMH